MDGSHSRVSINNTFCHMPNGADGPLCDPRAKFQFISHFFHIFLPLNNRKGFVKYSRKFHETYLGHIFVWICILMFYSLPRISASKQKPKWKKHHKIPKNHTEANCLLLRHVRAHPTHCTARAHPTHSNNSKYFSLLLNEFTAYTYFLLHFYFINSNLMDIFWLNPNSLILTFSFTHSQSGEHFTVEKCTLPSVNCMCDSKSSSQFRRINFRFHSRPSTINSIHGRALKTFPLSFFILKLQHVNSHTRISYFIARILI